MTTIAVENTGPNEWEMACDSKICLGDTFLTNADKIKRLSNGGLLACAGDAYIEEVVEFFETYGCTSFPTVEDVEGMGISYIEGFLIRPDGRLFSFALQNDEDGQLATRTEITTGIAAIGSGREFALGAMAAGKSPEAAVKIAALYDIYTGGPCHLHTFKLSKEDRAHG